MKCNNINCKNKHLGNFGSGKFCCRKCANSRTKNRNTINLKISKSLSGRKLSEEHKRKIRLNHGTKKLSVRKKISKALIGRSTSLKRRKQISLFMKERWTNSEYRKKMSKLASLRAFKTHSENDSFGWQSRKGMKMSYPETIAKRKLDEIGINYIYDYKCGKYFIDFAIIDKNIAIEIDGQQHKIKERKEKDKKKDQFLKSKNWKVYRISYPEENIREGISKILGYSLMVKRGPDMTEF